MRTGKHTVLVVDPEPGILDIVRTNLEAEGFGVICVGSGAEALQQTAAVRPDLVVLEPLLPDLDGWGVLARLHSHPATADLPVVVLTAAARDADVLRGLEAGAVEYLAKPFYPADLVASVKLQLLVFDTALCQGRREALIARRRRLMRARSRPLAVSGRADPGTDAWARRRA